MKVAIVSSEFPPFAGAAAARVYTWFEHLKKRGHQVTILTSNNINHDSEEINCSFFPTPNNRANLFFRLIQEVFLGLDLGVRLWKKRQSIKICILSSPPFFMSLICSCFARLAKVPYAFDIRDRYPNVLFDLEYINSKSWVGKLFVKIEHCIYKNAQIITTVTNGLYLDLCKEFPSEESKFLLVQNGYDEDVFGNISKHIHNKNKSFTIAYHGRLGKFYDAQGFIEVMNLVGLKDPTIQFLLIGDIPDAFKKKVGQNVEFMNVLPINQLATEISKCHLGICLLKDLPVMKKAFPAKVYDFIGAGLPVLVAPNGELAKRVKQLNIGSVFKKVVPMEIANEIINLKNNHGKIEKLQANLLVQRPNFGRKQASVNFLSKLIKNNKSEH